VSALVSQKRFLFVSDRDERRWIVTPTGSPEKRDRE